VHLLVLCSHTLYNDVVWKIIMSISMKHHLVYFEKNHIKHMKTHLPILSFSVQEVVMWLYHPMADARLQ
jgi:hypothetical protein